MKGLSPNVPTNYGLRYSRPFAEGGAVEHMQVGGVKKGWTALTQLEKDYNLAKFLEQSAVKDRLYHGTGRDITSFRPNLESGATFLTPNPAFANKFAMDDLLYDANSTYRGAPSGANVMPVYAQVKNPWDYENPKHIEAVAKILDPQDRKAFRKQAPSGNWLAIEDHYPSIQQAGFDAAHVMEGGVKNLGVFNQKAIKSALGNRGTYDVTDLDITKAEGGKVEHMQAGGLKTLMGEVLNRGGSYAARRLERAADEIPNLEKLFQEQALQRAFLGDNARALMTIKPSDFEKYAAPIGDLRPESSSNIVDLIGIKNQGGYKDVPFLEVNKKLQGSTGLPFISGHEGRHRNRAMDQSGEQASLVQFLPRSELREPFERRYQEQYIDAIRKEMALTGNKVMPEKYYESVKDPSGRIVETRDMQRPVIDLPDLYAEGGVVHKQAGGAMGLLNEFKALQAAHNAARLAKTTRNIPPVQDMVISQSEREANLARYLENAAVKDRMYHATGDDFSVVDVDKSDPRSKFGTGFYMTPNTNYANFFGNLRSKEGKPSQVMPVYSSVRNPYEISGTQNIPLTGIDREKLKALGHDGVLFRNDAGKVQEVVAFDPTQVKSAIGNRGTYDPAEVEMTKAEGGAVHMNRGGDALKALTALLNKSQGAHGAQRLERAADLIPNLESMYTQQALKDAFTQKNALTIMPPSDFGKLAERLRISENGGKQSSPASRLKDMSLDEYVAHLGNVTKQGGFDSTPQLWVGRFDDYIPHIAGHEGRHRSLALDSLGQPNNLVQVLQARTGFSLPSGKDKMPAKLGEKYIQKMNDFVGEQRLVTPEGGSLLPKDLSDPQYSWLKKEGIYDDNVRALPELFNEGGAVHSQADDGDIMRSLFDHALDKGDIHEMTHAMLVKQHEAEYG